MLYKKAKAKKTVRSVDSVSSQNATENACFLSNLIYLPGNGLQKSIVL
jgi:hypothetical protein